MVNEIMRKISLVIACAGAHIGVAAQGSFVVDPGGGGQFRDLQLAIDTVPHGSLLRVVGGVWGSLTIPKSLTIVGDPAPLIRSAPEGLGNQPPAITLSGSGSDTLTLSGVVVRGPANGAAWSRAGEGIAGGGFRDVRVLHSTVHAHTWTIVTGTAIGASGIALSGNPRLVVIDCDVRANFAITDSRNTSGPDGAAGINVPGGLVYVFDSHVEGGEGGEMRWDLGGTPSPSPCPCPGTSGAGGAAVSARTVADANCELRGGLGGRVDYYDWSTRQWLPWGRQSNGPQVAALERIFTGSDPVPLSSMRLGRPWELVFTVPTSGPGAILLALDLARVPLRIGTAGALLVEVSTIATTMPVATGANLVRLSIPAVPSLLGGAVATQFLNVYPGPSLTLGRASYDIVGF